MLEYMLYLIILFLSLALVTCIFYTYKFSLLLLDIQDIIEESLDDLDQSYINLNKILEKPIFFDSVEVRLCISEIKRARVIIIKIANKLTSLGNQKDVELQLNNNDNSQQEKQIERQEKDARKEAQ